MTIFDRALNRATQDIRAVSDTPRLDAELLLAEALNIDRDRLLLSPPKRDVPDRFWALVERRLNGEPIAYITGRRAFWNIELHVGPGVLIPRPDTEVLIASAIDHFGGRMGPKRILDLGTGPGTLLLAALDVWPGSTGVGVDSSRQALSYATANARRLGFDDRADFRPGNWGEGIVERFDLVLCNPPYVAAAADLGPGVREYEPAEALFSGSAGYDDLATIAPQISSLLDADGMAGIEIGSDQAERAIEMFQSQGLQIELAQDLAGRPRALICTPG